MLITFHIQLNNITNPTIWRQVTVPANFSFAQFHDVIQTAFGWEFSHLYQFSQKGYESEVFIGEPSDGEPIEDSMEIMLSEVFTKKGQKFIYIYDFGDDWEHTITVEKIDNTKAEIADCIGGQGVCPPEDCGGPWGYEEFKQTMADPKHPEHKQMREWLGLKKGQKWDPAAFDIEAAKKAVNSA